MTRAFGGYLEYYCGNKTAHSQTGLVKKLETEEEFKAMTNYLGITRFSRRDKIEYYLGMSFVSSYLSLGGIYMFFQSKNLEEYITSGALTLPGLAYWWITVGDTLRAENILKKRLAEKNNKDKQ